MMQKGPSAMVNNVFAQHQGRSIRFSLAKQIFASLGWQMSAVLLFAPIVQAAEQIPVEPYPAPASVNLHNQNSQEELPDVEMGGTEDDDSPSLRGKQADPLASDLPEPYLCEFGWVKREGEQKFSWISTGSEYPRIVPPLMKREFLAHPFSRAKTQSGPSWGVCAEAEPSAESSQITVVLYAHSSKGRSKPEDSQGRCLWTSDKAIVKSSQRIKLKIGNWDGIDFLTVEGERKRYSIHWPDKTDSDGTGSPCRTLASQMNKPGFESKFTKLNLR